MPPAKRSWRPHRCSRPITMSASMFQPLPFLGNPHVQTILGSFYQGRTPPLSVHFRTLTLPDGDRLALLYQPRRKPPKWKPGGWIACSDGPRFGRQPSLELPGPPGSVLVAAWCSCRAHGSTRGGTRSRLAREASITAAARKMLPRGRRRDAPLGSRGSSIVLVGFSLGGEHQC